MTHLNWPMVVLSRNGRRYDFATSAWQNSPVRAISQLRAVISSFERHTHATPLSVRFTSEDLITVELQDFKFILDRRDHAVSGSIIAQGWFEKHVTSAIRQFLRPGMIAIDIGANIGFQTMHMAAVVGTSGMVYAIEPSSENCRLIVINAEENNFSHIAVHPVALSDMSGYVLITPQIGSNGLIFPVNIRDFSHTVVACTKLDSLIDDDQRINLIKIDVEGYEYRAVRGALDTIRRSMPVIVSELSPYMLRIMSNIRAEEYLSMMTSLGYATHLIDKNQGIQPEVAAGKLLSEWGGDDRIEDVVFLPHDASHLNHDTSQQP